MRNPGEIRQKYKQSKYRARKNALQAGLKPSPRNCFYNSLFESSSGKKVGLCCYRQMEEDLSWPMVLCDREMPEGKEQARSCEHFRPLQTKKEIRFRFDFLVGEAEKTGDLGPLAYHYPVLAALLWVLGAPLVAENDKESGEC